MEEEKPRRGKLVIDYDTLLAGKDEEPPALLIVKSNTTETRKDSAMASDHQHFETEYIKMRDHELDEKIKRHKRNIEGISHKLPDKGEKLRLCLKIMEDEKERRRKLRPVETVCLEEADGCEKPLPPRSSSIAGGSDGLKNENTSHALSQSLFASCFNQKIEENKDSGTIKPFDKELSILGSCNLQKIKNNGEFSQRGRRKSQSSGRHIHFKSLGNLSQNGDKCVLSHSDQKGRASSILSLPITENSSNFFIRKKDASQVGNSVASRPRRAHTIDLEDEEEPQVIEIAQWTEKLAKWKDAKIYYPSRDDPEAVEILYSDIDCLSPQGYLTSTIMNFYIRYLQQHASPTNRAVSDCHFFNTYFYLKVKEAVSNKAQVSERIKSHLRGLNAVFGSQEGNNKDNIFVKLRRWWKGVNIFQKAYVLIPIHEDLHWSLVIICVPDEEEESGPIVLHLDSLGLHSSRSVFRNIKSFLKEEWCYLDQEGDLPDLPIADRIWRQLPQRITEKIISVPQQKNDYDCGIFVLYFMERFIEEAPERLKKKDLAMFGKQWFKPEEASRLREKIWNVLNKEFEKACEVDCTSDPSSSE